MIRGAHLEEDSIYQDDTGHSGSNPKVEVSRGQ